MAAFSVCHKFYYKCKVPPQTKDTSLNMRCIMCKSFAIQDVYGYSYVLSSDNTGNMQRHVVCDDVCSLKGSSKRSGVCAESNFLIKEFAPYKATKCTSSVVRRDRKAMLRISSSFDDSSQKGKLCDVSKACSITEKQLRSLDSYFAKLSHGVKQLPTKLLEDRAKLLHGIDQFNSEKGFSSLENYLIEKSEDAKSKNCLPSAFDDEKFEALSPISLDNGAYQSGREKKSRSYVVSRYADGKDDQNSADYESSNFYVTGLLASVNIAVLLFEIASPVKNSDLELFSLPFVYGAKINHLILVGEWWRLVTPMFLHSGVFHTALSCWTLLTFGPQVCKAYGLFTFILIYILGGLSGNLISFLHTPEATVGGTGPVFAVIGAWFVYELQNKDGSRKDASESMFQKAIIATTLSFVVSNFGPIDNWTHFGAAFTGIIYGFLTCPTLQVDDASAETGGDDGITLVRQYADPCKSLMYFFLLVLLLSSLAFVFEPPLINSSDGDSF